MRAVLFGLVLVLVGCQPVTEVAPGSPMQADTLTADGGDRYHLEGDMARLSVAALEGNTGGNTRVAVTLAWTPAVRDQAVCATFADASADGNQQGLVLRWDGSRGVTVTKNIYRGVTTAVNVHRWEAGEFTSVGGWHLSGLGAPLPWRMCASAVGDVVWFKVWPLAEPEPADHDPCCSGGVLVDVGDGRPGWYVGHLLAGEHVTYTDLSASPG